MGSLNRAPVHAPSRRVHQAPDLPVGAEEARRPRGRTLPGNRRRWRLTSPEVDGDRCDSLVPPPPAHVSPDPSEDSRRRVHSRLALALLETLKAQDLPQEILDDENVSVTLPRRLGLSNVVETQIYRYREEARRRRRLTDQEVVDLFRLVSRRPDAAQVFLRVGERLAGKREARPRRSILPTRLARYLGRRRIQKRLAWLFGRRMVRTSAKPLRFELANDLLLRADEAGSARNIVLGFARVELARTGIDGDQLVPDEADSLSDGTETNPDSLARLPVGWVVRESVGSNPTTDDG